MSRMCLDTLAEPSTMKKTTLLAVLALGSAFAPIADAATMRAPVPMAMFGVDATDILAEVDRRASVFKDQSYNASMEIIKDGQLKKTLKFTSVMKGLDKQLITFTEPGDVAGMKVLMEDQKNLFIYLREFKKVRRVATHVQSQGFLGSTFTYEDMTQLALSPFFNAELQKRDGSLTILTLTPKEGVESSWSKIDLTVDGTKGGVTHMRYYDGSGKDVREQMREEWIKIDGKLMPTKISMYNTKTGDVTVIKLSDIQVNQGVDDAVFSRRELLRG
jgi:outer membrane lipoprotein-sorting protein